MVMARSIDGALAIGAVMRMKLWERSRWGKEPLEGREMYER